MQLIVSNTQQRFSVALWVLNYVEYILLGKIQSDRLEGRFCKLRQNRSAVWIWRTWQDSTLVCQKWGTCFKIQIMNTNLQAINASNQLLQAMDIQKTPPATPSSTEIILFYVAGYFSRSVSKWNCDIFKLVPGLTMFKWLLKMI